MRRATTLLVLAALLQLTRGGLSSGDILNWKCLAAGDVCNSATGPLACCSGHCCSDGACKPCLETARQNSSPTACLRGDRFTDFVAREYEFPVSIPGESYSIFTEADHQVNALLQPAAGATEIGLMFRGVGVHGPDTSIKVSLGEDSSFAVEVNDWPFRGTQMRLDGVTITAGCTDPDCMAHAASNQAITVSDRFMTLWIWSEQASGQTAPTLNFRAAVMGKAMSQVHGILGQSLDSRGSYVSAAPTTRVGLPSNLRFYGEGQPSDYSTSSLFSSDSTFSIFTRKADRRRRRRKRQILEGATLASLALASREEPKGKQLERYLQGRPF